MAHTVTAMERPPSVDALARSLAGTGLPHALLVDVARAAIADDAVADAPARADTLRRTLLTPVVNATGVLLHTNLGRAPWAHHQDARPQSLELDLATGSAGRAERGVGRLLATLCGAESAIVVNNNAAAVLLVLAALAAARDVPVSRGESVEIGGGFRVPEVMEQSGARLVDVGTTNRTRLDDYRRALERRGADVALVLKVHPSNYRVTGFVEDTPVAELATLGVPVVVDLGSGLVDAACPWWPGPHPPSWLAGEPAARQTLGDGAALVTFSGDKLLGGPQAGIIAGRHDLVVRCARHPLARALRPGGLVLAALQDLALAYLRRDVVDRVPFWRLAATTVDVLERRATDVAAATNAAGAVAVHTEALPGAGSAPGAVIPSWGVRIPGDHLAPLRAHDPPVIARARDGSNRARPAGRRAVRRRRARESHPHVRVIATAGHVDHGKSSLVLALTGTDPDRFAEEKRRGLTIDLGFAHAVIGGEEVSFIDVPGHVRFLRNMLAGVGGVSACLFVVAATEGWKPQSEEHLRILELVGVRHGVVALTKVDLLLADPDLVELAALEVTERVAGTFLAGAPIVPVAAPSGRGIDDLAQALGQLARGTPAAQDRGRPRLWIDRAFAARGSGTVVTGTLTDGSVAIGDHLVVEPGTRPVRVRGIQTLGRDVRSIGPGHRTALNLVGVDHGDVARGDVVIAPDPWARSQRVDATLGVLADLDHVVSRRGAYLAYIGSGEHPVRLRVLGPDAIEPGATSPVRLHLQTALPLLPGDRYVLRESGRDETIGGGEILDVAPLLPASRARPDRSVERVIAERGWVEAGELDLLTGERRTPTIGRWVVDPGVAAAAASELRTRIVAAGEVGLPVASLDERQRALLATLDGIASDGVTARAGEAADPLAEHPAVAALAAGGLAPPSPPGLDAGARRELARRGVLVERDGLWWHATAIDTAADLAAALLDGHPDGFTVAEFREAAGITRKHAVPLLAELDSRGITRRRDDRRIAGNLLPVVRSANCSPE